MKYRKKPVVIEAMQLSNLNYMQVKQWINDSNVTSNPAYLASGKTFAIGIHTLEGEMKAELGDWIIKGVKGEFYPCKPDIFQQTYELVE
jgi:hypothetical protein